MAECSAAVILAAGASRRMGEPKLLLPYRGDSVIRTIVKRVEAARFSPIVVVVGHYETEIRTALHDCETSFVTSPDPSGFASVSLHAGIQFLHESVSALTVLLPDMLHVSTAMMSAVHRLGCDSTARLTVSRYGDVFAPPLFFRRALFAELLAWHGEGCGKQVVMAHRKEANVLDWDPESLADIDTPEEYQMLVRETRETSPIDPRGESF